MIALSSFERCVRSDGTPPMEDLRDSRRWDADLLCQAICAYLQRLEELFAKHVSWVNIL